MSMTYKINLPVEFEQRYNWLSNKTENWGIPICKRHDLQSMHNWCRERLGTNRWNYYGKYRKIPFEFRFKSAEDFLAFKMTFGLHE